MPEDFVDPFASKESVNLLGNTGKVEAERITIVEEDSKVVEKLKSKEEKEFEEVHTEYMKIKNDRNEGEIPLNDPYWSVRDSLNRAHNLLEASRKK